MRAHGTGHGHDVVAGSINDPFWFRLAGISYERGSTPCQVALGFVAARPHRLLWSKIFCKDNQDKYWLFILRAYQDSACFALPPQCVPRK